MNRIPLSRRSLVMLFVLLLLVVLVVIGSDSQSAGLEDSYVFLPFVTRDIGNEWIRTYNWGSINDSARTVDGGIILVGDSGDSGYLQKVDASGKVIWSKLYDVRSDDYFRRVLAMDDGSIIAVGGTRYACSGCWDILVVKVDANGNILWQKILGGDKDEGDYPFNITASADGGVVVAVFSNSFSSSQDGWFFKLRADGSLAWQKKIGGSSRDYVRAIGGTTDGGFIMAGYTDTSDPAGVWIIRLDRSGAVLWQKVYTNNWCDPQSIIQTSDGGYVMAGYGGKTNADGCLMKFRSSGGLEWWKLFDLGGDEQFGQIREDEHGNLFVSGSQLWSSPVWLMKLDMHGGIIWQRGFENIGYPLSIAHVTQDNIIVAGSQSLLKLSADGIVRDCDRIYDIQAQLDDLNGSVKSVNFEANSTTAVLVDANGTLESISVNDELVCPSAAKDAACANQAFVVDTELAGGQGATEGP